jgi:hypothetical protein
VSPRRSIAEAEATRAAILERAVQVASVEGLEGLTIGPGWRRAVQARLGGVQGCTHLVELLGPLATTAYQTIHGWRTRHEPQLETDRPPSHLDSCHALARTGAVVRQHYPRWYTGTAPQPGA